MKIPELFSWKTKEDIIVQAYKWIPEVETSGVICLVHGMGEHAQRYHHLSQHLNQLGFAVFTFDLIGHGKSGKTQGHTPSYESLLDQIDQIFIEKDKLFADLPCFLYGHSAGGNLVLNYTLKRKPPIKGLIVTSPWLKLAFSPPAFKLALGKVMRKVWPSFREKSNLDTSALSRDETQVEKYKNDPLVHNWISTTYFFGIHEAGIWALNHAKHLKTPTLLMHGSGDKVTDHLATKEFAEKVTPDLMNLKIWDGFYHEIHMEPEKELIYKYLTNWLKEQQA